VDVSQSECGAVSAAVTRALVDKGVLAIMGRRQWGLNVVQKNAGINQLSELGMAPLGAAAYAGWLKGTTELLNWGADPNGSATRRMRPVVLALLGATDRHGLDKASIKNCAVIVHQLASAGADMTLLRPKNIALPLVEQVHAYVHQRGWHSTESSLLQWMARSL